MRDSLVSIAMLVLPKVLSSGGATVFNSLLATLSSEVLKWGNNGSRFLQLKTLTCLVYHFSSRLLSHVDLSTSVGVPLGLNESAPIYLLRSVCMFVFLLS